MIPDKMSSLRSDSSGEGSTITTDDSLKNKRKEMGRWLSLLPPGSHSCVLCSQKFNAFRAMGGNQNVRRTLRFQVHMHNLYLKMIEEEKQKKREIQEKKQKKKINVEAAAPVKVVKNDQSGVDLNLCLGFGSAKKVTEFYEFIPLKKRMKLRCGSSTDGGDRGVKASGDGGEAAGGSGNNRAKVGSKKGLDVALKLGM